MMIVQVVVDLGGVELTSITEGLPSERAGVLSGDTTVIISEMVD